MSKDKNNSPSKYFISYSYFTRGMPGFGNDIIVFSPILTMDDIRDLEHEIQVRSRALSNVKILYFQEINNENT